MKANYMKLLLNTPPAVEDEHWIHFLGKCGCFILLIYFINELLDWAQRFSICDRAKAIFETSDAFHKGSLNSKDEPKSQSKKQSPVNIETREVVIVNEKDHLAWFDYSCQPQTMTMTNDGDSVKITASWLGRIKPKVRGGPLKCTYVFNSMLFHWGRSDKEGSEHTINFHSFPLELQMVHEKHRPPNEYCDRYYKEGQLIIAYLFKITEEDNPFMDSIVNNLRNVLYPGCSVDIPSLPLDWLCPTFECNYYQYDRSLTQKLGSKVVTSIVQPDPIGISEEQVAQFREVKNNAGHLVSNSRLHQHLNCMRMFYYR